MTHFDARRSRTLTVVLASVPPALLVVAAALFPDSASLLTPFALVVPPLSIASVEAALLSTPSAPAPRESPSTSSLRCAGATA